MSASPQSLRILLAGDNPINYAVTTAMLPEFPHALVHAANGREAVAAVEREEFDLILMDVQMPEMDGFEATRLIRAIIAMTAHAMAGDRERCLAAGMDGYLSEPMEIADLLVTINAILLASEVTEKDRPSQGMSFSVADLLAHLDGNEKLLHNLVSLFAEHTPRCCAKPRKPLREDHAAVARLAHQLSGSLRNLRAPRAAQVAADLGEAAQLGNLARARKLAKVLSHEADTISSRLGDWESSSAGALAPAEGWAAVQLESSLPVIIAEEDLVSRELLIAALEKFGYRVIATRDGREAMEIICAQTTPVLAVIDWMMAGLDGIEICRRVREADKVI